MTQLALIDLLIPDRLPDEGFHRLYAEPEFDRTSDLKWPLVQPELRKLFRALGRAERPWPLYLWGGVGHGKTEAVRAFCRRVYKAHYWTVDDIMARRPWEEFWGSLSLTVLDELGLPRPSDGARDYDYDCVKNLLDWRRDRPAIYVSNRPLDEIDRLYDTRIKSRLGAGTVYELRDHDRRLR
jgi:hypothetical protein